MTNLLNYGTGRRPIGASTITQQVTKNFLLTNELSIERKIKEAILSLRMERAFSKNQILELYLNEIYLGMGSYGVAAAALNTLINLPINWRLLKSRICRLAERQIIITRSATTAPLLPAAIGFG